MTLSDIYTVCRLQLIVNYREGLSSPLLTGAKVITNLLFASLIAMSIVLADEITNTGQKRVVFAGAALFWVYIAASEGLSSFASLDDIDGGTIIVPAVGVRSALLGLLAARFARKTAIYTLGVTGGLLALFAVDLITVTTSNLLYASQYLGLLLFYITAQLAGQLGGFAVRYYNRGAIVSDKVRLVSRAAMVIIIINFTTAIEYAVQWFSVLPVAWYAYLTSPLKSDATPSLIALLFASHLIIIPALYLSVERLAERTWFIQPYKPNTEATADVQFRTFEDRLIEYGISRPTVAILGRTLRVSFRTPESLSIFGSILFTVIVIGTMDIHEVSQFLPSLAMAFTVPFVFVLTGVAHDESERSLIFMSPASATEIIYGYLATALILGTPPTVLLVAICGYQFGLTLVVAASLLVMSIALIITSAFLALSILTLETTRRGSIPLMTALITVLPFLGAITMDDSTLVLLTGLGISIGLCTLISLGSYIRAEKFYREKDVTF